MSSRIAVCDYGVGNLRSVERALEHAEADVVITSDPATISAADGLILPGVGAFGAAVDNLEKRGLSQVVLDYAASGRPLLGVCLGFQLLYESSDENGGAKGLGLISGDIRRITGQDLKVPQIGWNQLDIIQPSRLLDDVQTGSYVYFVHSYAVGPGPHTVATTEYGSTISAACSHDNVMGTQFHPEKSGKIGLQIYANFVDICTAPVAA